METEFKHLRSNHGTNQSEKKKQERARRHHNNNQNKNIEKQENKRLTLMNLILR
jgi:hypothetical protein